MKNILLKKVVTTQLAILILAVTYTVISYSSNSITKFNPDSDSINIRFTDIKPHIYYDETSYSSCDIIGNVYNTTKYHLNGLSFKVGELNFNISDMPARSLYPNNIVLLEVSLNEGQSCIEIAQYLIKYLPGANILECSIPNIAEGDCQDSVRITSGIDLSDTTAAEQTIIENKRKKEANEKEEQRKAKIAQRKAEIAARAAINEWMEEAPSNKCCRFVISTRDTEALVLMIYLGNKEEFRHEEVKLCTKATLFFHHDVDEVQEHNNEELRKIRSYVEDTSSYAPVFSISMSTGWDGNIGYIVKNDFVPDPEYHREFYNRFNIKMPKCK